MNRGQFVAVLIGMLGIVGVVVAVTSGSDDGTETAVAPASAAAGDSTETTSAGDTTAETDATDAPTTTVLDDAPENFGPAPDLVEIEGWLQTEATSFSDFDGQVKIVKFWTFGCRNCINTLPHIRDIYDRYRDEGLEIIGVHAPEFDFERDPDAVFEATQRLEVTWPVALDPDKTNFRAWQEGRRFWPRTFVVDANGDIRYDHIGEGRYDELEATVAWLLANGGA